MADHPAHLRKSFDMAVAAAPAMLQRCLDHAGAALQEAETQSGKVTERRDLSDAWRELLRWGPQWVGQFPRELLRELDGSSAQPAATPAPEAFSGTFTLVDDAALDQTIQSARLSQQLLPMGIRHFRA